MTGPIGSEYPGTPVVFAFLGLFAAVLGKSALSAHRRKNGVTGQQPRVVDAIVTIMAAIFVLVVLWAMWTHR